MSRWVKFNKKTGQPIKINGRYVSLTKEEWDKLSFEKQNEYVSIDEKD